MTSRTTFRIPPALAMLGVAALVAGLATAYWPPAAEPEYELQTVPLDAGEKLIAAADAPAAVTIVDEAVPEKASEQSLKPQLHLEDKHFFTARLVADYIRGRHYVKTDIDDAFSSQVLDRYLSLLDPDKLYFQASDIDRFNEIRYDFDEYINKGRLEPAFAIFHIYRVRVQKRINLALDLLERDFDFTRDEWYDLDREDDAWASTADEIEDLWRKRVKNDLLSLILSDQEEADARETLRKRYQQIRTRTEQLKSNDVFQFFTNAYLVTVEPHTSYLSPRASANFKIRMSLSLEGIGAVLQNRNEYTRVTSIVPGGPADMSGELKAGDQIIGVGQGEEGEIVDVIGWRLDDVVERIRGPKGTIVRLRVLHEDAASGDSREILITRDRIKLEEQAAKSSILEVEHDDRTERFGVIDIPTFYADLDGRAQGDPQYRSTTKDVRKLINELKEQDVDAIIMDLRGNPGGALSEAISLTGLFIESGPIVQVRDLSGRVRINRDPDPSVTWTGPLAVMVDRHSASASEIFAGAIQDYRRGIVIGEPTFGKGTVQHVVNLSRHSRENVDLGRLKLTVAQFFRVNGDSTQHRGVVPDILFPTASFASDEGERAYENALPWSRVGAAEHDTRYRIDRPGLFGQLIHRFDQRQSESAEMRYIREAEEFAGRSRDIERISLNETERRAELDRRRKEGIEIENRLRKALDMPLRALDPDSDDDVEQAANDDSPDGNETGDFPPDVMLEEAGMILADFIDLSSTREQQLADLTKVAPSSAAN